MDADLSLEVTAPSLGGKRRDKIQEERSDMDLKKMFVGLLTARVHEEIEFGHNPKQECECMSYQL